MPDNHSPDPDITSHIAGLLKAEGIEQWAIVPAESGEVEAERDEMYARWIASGRHGDMQFLANHEPMKFHPDRVLDGCRSVIIVAVSYFTGRQPAPVQSATTPNAGRIARYALGRDYHKELGGKLRRVAGALASEHPDHSFRAFTDTSPTDERYWAQKSGLSFPGRHTLAINRELGSWFFLGEILTTLELDPVTPPETLLSHCPGGCRRCLDICPTGALESSGLMNASRCISYLTIEHKGTIEPGLMEKMGDWIFGCDLCQDVCPFNIAASRSETPAFTSPLISAEQDLADLLSMKSHDDFVKRFAGTPVMRAGWKGMLRNCLIAAANSGRVDLALRITELSHHEDEVVAATARWALERLG